MRWLETGGGSLWKIGGTRQKKKSRREVDVRARGVAAVCIWLGLAYKTREAIRFAGRGGWGGGGVLKGMKGGRQDNGFLISQYESWQSGFFLVFPNTMRANRVLRAAVHRQKLLLVWGGGVALTTIGGRHGSV